MEAAAAEVAAGFRDGHDGKLPPLVFVVAIPGTVHNSYESSFATTDSASGSRRSRYDPNDLIRVAACLEDIDDWSSSEDTEQCDNRSRGQGRAGFIAFIAGMILAASVAICIVVVDPRKNPFMASRNIPAARMQLRQTAPAEQQFITSREVISACSESKLDEDMSDCRRLCRDHLCCFEEGRHGCAADEGKDCAVYAACEALVKVGALVKVWWG